MNKSGSIRLWLSYVFRMAFFALALMLPAGTWKWWEAWVVVGLWGVYGLATMIFLLRHDPALLAERLKFIPVHKEQKSWDKAIMVVFFITGVALYLVPGFDVVRFEWSEPLPLWLRIIAMFLHLPCFVLLGWVMHENTYLSQVVKIDKARGHKVVTTGPYALVRHPMYSIVIVLLFVVPVALGSRYALILAVVLTLLLIVRTYFEDRTLHLELEGYPEYAKTTRYQLIPRLW